MKTLDIRQGINFLAQNNRKLWRATTQESKKQI